MSVREASVGAASDEDCAAAATFVLTGMEGAVMQSLSAESIEPFDQCVGELRRYLVAVFPKKEGASS